MWKCTTQRRAIGHLSPGLCATSPSCIQASTSCRAADTSTHALAGRWRQPATRIPPISLTGPTSGTWSDLGAQQFNHDREGTAVIQIDTSATPPAARVTILGGGVLGAATVRNPQTAETIDPTVLAPAPAWTRMADMQYARVNVNAVLLPDGNIFVVGGQRAGKWNADPQAVLEPEMYDPRNDTWTTMAPMEHPRQYHSIAVLLPDGRVLTAGGVDPRPVVLERDQRSMEVFSPPYL